MFNIRLYDRISKISIFSYVNYCVSASAFRLRIV